MTGVKLEYHLGRKCEECNQLLWDTNKTGICPECWGHRIEKANQGNGESAEHKELKLIAHRFLSKLHYMVLGEEITLNCKTGKVRVDVLGKNIKGDLVAVECGGSQRKKLAKMSDRVIATYILPYNSQTPYQWSDDMKICQNCGHIISFCNDRNDRFDRGDR